MRVRYLVHFSDNISTLLLVNVSSSLKARWMQLVGQNVCQDGLWFLYHQAQLVQRRLYKNNSHCCKATMRLFSFTTMTNQVVKPLKSVLVYYRLVRSRLPTFRATTRTHQTPSKPTTLTLYAELSGTPSRSALMALSMAKLF